MKKAIFLDRDGVVNKAFVREGKPFPPMNLDSVHILDGVCESIIKLRQAGYEIVVVTNQPDIARKKIEFKKVQEIHKYISEKTQIRNYYICPHDDIDNCECRKPKIGLLLSAAYDLNLDLEKSIVIGDRWRDIQAGQQAGCKCFFIDYSYRERRPIKPYIKVSSLEDAVKRILGESCEI